MEEVRSVNGVSIRLTAERWMHITEARDELAGRAGDILDAVEFPDWVTKGYRGSLVAWKGYGRRGFLAVIYKELSRDDGFIINLLHEEGQEEGEGMAQIEQLRTTDYVNILKVVPQLVQFPARQFWVDYDAEADVLYVSFRKPQHATDSNLRDDGIIVHRRGKRIVGLTILDASTR